MHRILLVVAMTCICTSGGCRRSDRPLLAPVSGTVTYNGQALLRGTITLLPESGRPASGKIVEGKIVDVTTFELNDGALVGRHRIQIASFIREPRAMEIVPWAIPERYGKAATSDLTAEVVAGKQNELHLELH